jgi:exonuclease SbcC
MSHEEFIATYCTEQKGLEFLSGKRGTTEREKFVVRMMGYDRLEKMQEFLRDDRKEKRAIAQGFEASIGSVEELEARIATEKEMLHEIRKKHDEAMHTLQKGERELETHRIRHSKLLETRERVVHHRQQVVSAKLRIEERSKRSRSLDESAEKIVSQLAEIRKAYQLEKDLTWHEDALQERQATIREQLERCREEERLVEIRWRERLSTVESEYSQATRMYRDLRARFDELSTLGLQGECPTCRQTFGASFSLAKDHFSLEVAQAEKSVQELEDRIGQARTSPAELAEVRGKIELLERSLGEVRSVLQGVERGVALEARKAEVEVEREAMKIEQGSAATQLLKAEETLAELRFSEEEYQGVKGSFEVAQRLVEVARLQRVKLEGEMNLKAALVARTESELQQLHERRGEVENLKRELRILDEGDRVLTEFRKQVNASIRPRLSELASEYIADLTDGRYTSIELAEDFTPTVIEDGEAKPVISGGEEDILNLCMRLALSHMLAERAGQQFSLLVLDEIFGSLDEGRRGNVLTLLEKLRKRFEQIIVITHLDDVKEGVQRLIEVEYNEATGAAVVSARKRIDEIPQEGAASNF